MIDTNKYEGYTEGPWKHMYQAWGGVDYIMSPHEGCVAKIDNGDKSSVENRANAQLIADAPLLLEEIKRLRKALYWVAVEETRDDVDYMWEGVDEILSDHPSWAQTKCIQTGEQWDYTKRDWTIDTAKSDVISDGLRRMIE